VRRVRQNRGELGKKEAWAKSSSAKENVWAKYVTRYKWEREGGGFGGVVCGLLKKLPTPLKGDNLSRSAPGNCFNVPEEKGTRGR